MPDLRPDADEIAITHAAPPRDVGTLPSLDVVHGLGRARGTRAGAVVLLKNTAAELGAVRVHIVREKRASDGAAYRIEAVAVMPRPLQERDFVSDVLHCRQDKHGRRCASELRMRKPEQR